MSSKLYGYESLLAPLIAEACIDVVPANPANFNVDNVRVVKINGGWTAGLLVSSSGVVGGWVGDTVVYHMGGWWGNVQG